MLQPMEEPPVEQVDVAWKRLWLMENPHGSRPRARAAALGEEPTQEQGSGGSCHPWGTRAGAVCSWGMDPLVWTQLEQFLKSCCLWEAHTGSVHQRLHPV